MRAGKSNQEEDEFEEEDFISSKEGPSSTSIANMNSNFKDAKNNDKANAVRSKHSVTEQRRRSKINERFQMLRDLIPHSDQKRDTASFLLEVIEYVQYLQEKVQKYEGSYPIWNGEPSKLMPWRNSHWRVQSFSGQSHTVNNGSFPGSTFLGKVDDNNIPVAQNMEDSLAYRGVCDISSIGGASLQAPMQATVPSSVPSDGMAAQPLQTSATDAPSTEFLVSSEPLNQLEKADIEGGTIRISSPYSEGLLNKLTQALKDAGVDLSQANISIQIDIGKNADKTPPPRTSVFKNHESDEPAMHVEDGGSGEDSNKARKRFKT